MIMRASFPPPPFGATDKDMRKYDRDYDEWQQSNDDELVLFAIMICHIILALFLSAFYALTIMYGVRTAALTTVGVFAYAIAMRAAFLAIKAKL